MECRRDLVGDDLSPLDATGFRRESAAESASGDSPTAGDEGRPVTNDVSTIEALALRRHMTAQPEKREVAPWGCT